MKRAEITDPSGMYRYWLLRQWEDGGGILNAVMLNPSTADAVREDPTIRRCLGFARSWGYGTLEVTNLFAFRATNPSELNHVAEPIGIDCNRYLEESAYRADRILVAWGNRGGLLGRDRQVIQLLAQVGDLYCLGLTKLGRPYHPLYLPKATRLRIFQPRSQILDPKSF